MKQYKYDTRNYGFIPVPGRFAEDVAFALYFSKSLVDDDEIKYYLDDILRSLADPENSRLTSPTDNFDAIEDYFVNRISCYNLKLHDDKVYKILSGLKMFFEKRGVYEMCFNIQKCFDILESWNKQPINNEI